MRRSWDGLARPAGTRRRGREGRPPPEGAKLGDEAEEREAHHVVPVAFDKLEGPPFNISLVTIFDYS